MYPTKQQIMKKPWTKHKIEAVKMMKIFKDCWNKIKKSKVEKCLMLESMLTLLGEIYDNPVKIKFHLDAPSCYYERKTKTININKSLSIISSLHEFAHHLYEPSELKACRWSVHLFRKVFKEEFKKLSWDGHMLKKEKHANKSRKSRKLQSSNTKK